LGGLFDLLFGYEPDEEDEEETVAEEDLPHAPDQIPFEPDGYRDLVEEIDENQTRGEEDGIDAPSDTDEQYSPYELEETEEEDEEY
jgi:hypothetical protein